jgi:hypothetical protein
MIYRKSTLGKVFVRNIYNPPDEPPAQHSASVLREVLDSAQLTELSYCVAIPDSEVCLVVCII